MKKILLFLFTTTFVLAAASFVEEEKSDQHAPQTVSKELEDSAFDSESERMFGWYRLGLASMALHLETSHPALYEKAVSIVASSVHGDIFRCAEDVPPLRELALASVLDNLNDDLNWPAFHFALSLGVGHPAYERASAIIIDRLSKLSISTSGVSNSDHQLLGLAFEGPFVGACVQRFYCTFTKSPDSLTLQAKVIVEKKLLDASLELEKCDSTTLRLVLSMSDHPDLREQAITTIRKKLTEFQLAKFIRSSHCDTSYIHLALNHPELREQALALVEKNLNDIMTDSPKCINYFHFTDVIAMALELGIGHPLHEQAISIIRNNLTDDDSQIHVNGSVLHFASFWGAHHPDVRQKFVDIITSKIKNPNSCSAGRPYYDSQVLHLAFKIEELHEYLAAIIEKNL